jgi:nicotinate (nicotinamide) nucleotide adenylyltransferase
MKIAVLFGSFNPMTNAHVSALKKVVEILNAEKGLFVATNGQYLKRKAVKIGDAFYLTEEERKQVIDEVCQNEPKLEFGGFELGGINPNRYKTLSKIQKQYPNADLYEVMGNDKLRTLTMSKQAADYLSNVHFAVFSRLEIDVDELFNNNEVLDKYRDSFVFLPAINEGLNVSSTEVRRRFYAGEDYSDLVPPSTLEVMSRHNLTEFNISFVDRIKTLMRTGRYGENNACKLVYAENTKLFNDWKNGKSQIDFGDYATYLDGAKLYKESYDVNDIGITYDSCTIGCINADCMDVAESLLEKGYNPAILNLASAKKPCGGYAFGMQAQEESLCHNSTLSLSLCQYGDPRYKNIRESGVPHKCIGYPFDINYGGIYTPNVVFFRQGKSKFYDLRENPFKCDVITVAGLSFNGRMDYSYADELAYRSESGGFTSEGTEIMLNKIRTIFRMAVEHGKDSIVLGALSCGAYKCPPEEVAKQFRTVIEESEFKNKFKLLVFAILEKPRKPHGFNGKFAPFYHEFGTYELK